MRATRVTAHSVRRFTECLLAGLFCAATTVAAQTFKTLASFNEFGYPQYMSLVEGTDGNLYGTAPADWGMVFEITAGGGKTALCYFGEDTCGQESFPFAGLIQATDGNFYGTTWQGGTRGPNGYGTVYGTTPGVNDVTLLYSFCSQSNCTDGADPFAPLLQARNGNFYGTTFNGGAHGYGTIFQITSAGALTTLYSFSYTDGAGPVAGLVQGSDGNFYGTTLYGGAKGAGTVFQMTPAGVLATLYSFCSQARCADGAGPYAGLVQATDGNFYGTTYEGGAHSHGTVFDISAAGKLTTLYSFCSQTGCTDGAHPYAGVIQATDGNFYGVTSQGGSGHRGTVFQITAAGAPTTMHSFCLQKNCTDGADPVGGLLQASDGHLYGTTAQGGAYEDGTVFSLSLARSRFVKAKVAPRGVEASVTAPKINLHASGHSPLWGVTARAQLMREQLAQVDRSAQAPRPAKSNLRCSPAPCVLPPTQASEGGSIVTDPLIVSDPANAKSLLLGSLDANCSQPSEVGFHISTDGGSDWKLVNCMPVIITKQRVYWPTFEPSVGYDRNGTAYGAGFYFDSEGLGFGFIAVQKSTNGTHWDNPVVALRHPGLTYPFETSLTVDTGPGSPWVNSVYVSGIMWLNQGVDNQVLVYHTADGGKTWTQVAVDSVQKYPEEEDFTRMAVGKDGTVYATWMRCRGKKGGGDGGGLCPTVHMMFSKSTDGGNSWSAPLQLATVKMPHYWELPNTGPAVRVYNYPVIAADTSDGLYAGNLYVAMYTWTGSYLRVQVIRSTDGGTTWSEPVRLAPKSDTHDQFFPAISVSPTGRIGVSWLDRRNDPNNIDYQAFAAFSDDGGQHFGTNWQLTQEFSNPNINGTYWMGDYTGNTWRDNNTFIAAWMDSSNGVDMQEVVGGVRLK